MEKYTYLLYESGKDNNLEDLTKTKVHVLTEQEAKAYNTENKDKGNELIKVKLKVTKVN